MFKANVKSNKASLKWIWCSVYCRYLAEVSNISTVVVGNIILSLYIQFGSGAMASLAALSYQDHLLFYNSQAFSLLQYKHRDSSAHCIRRKWPIMDYFMQAEHQLTKPGVRLMKILFLRNKMCACWYQPTYLRTITGQAVHTVYPSLKTSQPL